MLYFLALHLKDPLGEDTASCCLKRHQILTRVLSAKHLRPLPRSPNVSRLSTSLIITIIRIHHAQHTSHPTGIEPRHRVDRS